MANYAEQIAAFEAKHAANVATLKSLADKAGDAGETFDAEAQDQFDCEPACKIDPVTG